MQGTCLCGSVVFTIEQIHGPFELCHCKRCQKYSGSGYAAFLTAEVAGYRLHSGTELIRAYEAPLLHTPPVYTVWFCARCGSPVPNPTPHGETLDVPAGCLDDPIGTCPDKHIYVDLKADWEPLDKQPPQLSKTEIRSFRAKFGHTTMLPSGKPSPNRGRDNIDE